jgi:predicted anti-sigma-YlaC factor YlaD
MVCRAIQERLVEAAGDATGLGPVEFSHLEACPACRAVADAEAGLARLLAQAVPPEDPDVVREVMASIRPVSVRRRVAALLPVAASLVLALLGVVMMGGVPGASLLAQLPLVSSHSWLALAHAAGDWSVAMAAACSAARIALPPAILVGAMLVAVVGLGLIVVAARRWLPVASWRRDG